MKTSMFVALAALVLAAAGSAQVALNLSVVSGGQNVITAAPGSTVTFEIRGELANSQNLGLAMFSFDLSYSGGPLSPLTRPSALPMNHFDRPLGFTNPAGFGGTLSGGALLQVGGAQNTFNASLAPFPNGPVIQQVAWPSQAAVLATGTLVVPMAPGSSTVSLSNVFANVLRQGQSGANFWAVDPVQVGTLAPLIIDVVALTGTPGSLSLSTPGHHFLSLNAGVANAGRLYWVLGSVSGVSPGIPLANGLVIPLNYDPYFQYTIDYPDTLMLAGSLAFLDSQGQSLMVFYLPAGLPPQAATLTLRHAFVLLFPIDFVSNPVSLEIDP